MLAVDASEHVKNGVRTSLSSPTASLELPNSQQNSSNRGTCSMETVPCDLVDGFSSEDEGGTEEESVWGRLFPAGSSFTSFGKNLKEGCISGEGEGF